MIRDKELERLISYAKGLGLKVTFSNKDYGASALWSLDNSEITICKNKNKSKIETILSIIHELGHSLHNTHEQNRKIDTKLEEALNHIEDAEEFNIESKKRQRKISLDCEIAGTKYWHVIYKDTNMNFPIWRLEAAMEFDLYQYEYFYENDRWPSFKEKSKKKKEIKKKHRGRLVRVKKD